MTYGVAWQDPKDTKNQIHNSGSSLCWDAQSTVKVMGTVTVLITILPLSSPTHLHRSASSAYSYHCSHLIHIMALALLPFASPPPPFCNYSIKQKAEVPITTFPFLVHILYGERRSCMQFPSPPKASSFLCYFC